MAKYDQFIFKYKSMDPKPSVIEAISEILLEAGESGERQMNICQILAEVGYKHSSDVIRAYMNRHLINPNLKGTRNLWFRKNIGIYVSSKYYVKIE